MLLYTDELFERHQTGRHPECPARLAAIRRALADSGLLARCMPGALRTASPEEVARVHRPEYIGAVQRFAARGGGFLDPDTAVSPDSYAVAMAAAGTAVHAVDAVLTGPERRALCLVRPPGHHALPDHAMGFCLFGNVAVAAAHARAAHGLDRVLIVDWDVHHGNGTQQIFYADGQVHFLSAHRFPFYPGSGDRDETGTGAGLGATWNLPLRYGISRVEYRSAFAAALDTAVRHAQPQLILISAGFDAHQADPIGSLGLESEDFGTLTRLVLEAADTHCQGRVVSLLEGGYNLDALAESVCCHVETILDHERQSTASGSVP